MDIAAKTRKSIIIIKTTLLYRCMCAIMLSCLAKPLMNSAKACDQHQQEM